MTLDIEAIKARANAASAGPWHHHSAPLRKGMVVINAVMRGATQIVAWGGFDGADTSMAQRKKDAAFIAHARADIPALTAALEASENARLKAEQKFAQIGRDGDPQSCLDADGVPVEKARLRGEWIDQRDRITALEQERDALKEALAGEPFMNGLIEQDNTIEPRQQVNMLFKRNGLLEPPTRLRDELVVAFLWAWFGHKAARRALGASK